MQFRPSPPRRRILVSLLPIATSLVLGCAVDSTAPGSAPLSARLTAATAGPEFPNVIRFQDQFVFAIADPETDLLAVAGLPDDPMQEIGCGGSEPFAIVDIQFAGVRQDVIHALAKGDDVNVHVYQLSTFEQCVSSPIAVGKGRIVYVDNNAFLTGNRADSWGFRIGGTVSLVAGGTAHLVAHNRFQIHQDGTFRRVLSKVQLN